MDLPLFFTLPLIGGFAFVTGFFPLRWRSARQDAQRLYYRAAVWGGILAVTAAIAHVALLVSPTYRDLFGWLHTTFLQPLLTSKDPPPAPSLIIRAHVAWVCVYALLLGLGLPALGRAGLWVTRLMGMRLEVQLNLQTHRPPGGLAVTIPPERRGGSGDPQHRQGLRGLCARGP